MPRLQQQQLPGPIDLDLNIERMRTKIHTEMNEVMRPFLKRLEEIDVLERVLRRETGNMARQAGKRAKKTTNGNGHVHHHDAGRGPVALIPGSIIAPYSEMTQTEAVRALLAKDPGLGGRDVTERLVAGGYPFNTNRPLQSISTLLKTLTARGIIRKVEPKQSERAIGIRSRYWLADDHRAAPGAPDASTDADSDTDASASLSDMPLTRAMVRVIVEGPPKGLSRREILTELQARKYPFSKTSAPRKQITWTTAKLTQRGVLRQQGHGKDSTFTAIKPKFAVTKH